MTDDLKAHTRRAKLWDRIAQAVITSGGVSIIICVVLILVLIVKEALPLFYEARSEIVQTTSPAREHVIAVGSDEYLDGGVIIYKDGETAFFNISDDRAQETLTLEVPEGAKEIVGAETLGRMTYTFVWDNGIITLDHLKFKVTYGDDAVRRLIPSWTRGLTVKPPAAGVISGAASRMEEDSGTTVALLNNKIFQVTKTTKEEDFFGNVSIDEKVFTLTPPDERPIKAFALNGSGNRLYASTGDRLLLWDLRRPPDESLVENISLPADLGVVTAMSTVYGDDSVALGHASGKISTWSRVFTGSGSDKALLNIHRLTPHEDAIVSLTPSMRDKSLLSIDRSGVLHLSHTTSENLLVKLRGVDQLAYLSPRNNGLTVLADSGQVNVNGLTLKHPEINFRTLFGKVWYENYSQPEFVWQSSSADDDFEPKLSMVPLIFGSLKGTFYALIIAVPLAIFGALYTSQCTHPKVRAVIKPTVEIMAAVPSVIIGFLAALWLAPIVERHLASFFAAFITIPIAVLIMILIWKPIRRNIRMRAVEKGYEFLVLVPILILGCGLAALLGPAVEEALFDGNVKQAIFNSWGMQYDPRNCMIIAYALGFAVIPIIFTISEDAFSNVPAGLTAASLACGASRWQTVWRVVLPSASPGLFAATVIGFGRAVGETMIVLMATGNTPITDWSPFNGMRTLSANIAVEIPEAPVGGTLYRTLFLSAVLLFLLTSILNTIAELVRQRLRKKYGQFQ